MEMEACYILRWQKLEHEWLLVPVGVKYEALQTGRTAENGRKREKVAELT